MHKQQNRDPKHHLLQGFHSLVRDETILAADNCLLLDTSLNEAIEQLDQLFDNKAKIDFLLNEGEFLPEEMNSYAHWTVEWFQKHLEILNEFGQILVKKSRTSTVHMTIEDILPVTRLWNGYLQDYLPMYPTSDYDVDGDEDGDVDRKSFTRKHFYWDMYIVFRKPNQYQIRPYYMPLNDYPVTYIPNYFYITIPPVNNNAITNEKTGLPSSEVSSETATAAAATTTVPTAKRQDVIDPYELFRCSENFNFQNQPDRWNYISSEKISQSLFSTLLPEVLNLSACVEPGQTGLKVISWKCLFDEDNVEKASQVGFFPVEVVFDTNSLGSNHFYYSPELWKSQQTLRGGGGGIVTRRIQISKSVHTLTTPSIDMKSEKTGTLSTTLSSNLLTMRIRFHPVYSLNDLMSSQTKTTSTMTSTSSSTANNRYASAYLKHNFLKCLNTFDIKQNNFPPNLPLWKVCSCLTEECILERIDKADHGIRRKAVRILANLYKMNDLQKGTQLMSIFTLRNMIQICLQTFLEEINQTVQYQYENLFQSPSKVVVEPWQKLSLPRVIYQLLSKCLAVLHEKQLASFTSPESDILNVDSILTKQSMNQLYCTLNSWLRSPLELKKFILTLNENLSESIEKFQMLSISRETNSLK
ncbi:unnamed protein product [Trichobilharzia szidati]|nr:unnamed protein product [Trichobilharzia szidati]